MQVQINTAQSSQINLGLLKQQKYMEALDRYKQHITRFPNHLASILIDLYKELQKHPTNNHIRLIITDLYIKKNYVDEALNELHDMYEENPQFSQTYYLAHKLYTSNKNTIQIKNLFETAFQNGVRDSVVIDLLPKLYLDNNEIEKSILFFETLITENTSLPHHKKALAELYKQIGKYNESMATIKSLIISHPEYLHAGCELCINILKNHPDLTKIRQHLLEFYIKDCKCTSALEELNILIESASLNPSIILDYFKQLNDIFPGHIKLDQQYCDYLISQKSITEACLKLTSIHKNTEHEPYIHSCLKTLQKNSNHHIGLKLFEIKWAQHLHNYETALDLIENTTNTSEAEALLNELLILTSSIKASGILTSQNQCLYLEGLIHFKLGNIEKAAIFTESCDPDYAKATYLNILILVHTNKLNDAHLHCQKLLEKHIDQSRYHKLAHHIYLEKNKQTDLKHSEKIMKHLKCHKTFEAIENIQQISQENTFYPEAQLLLIRSFLDSGQFNQALTTSSHVLPYIESNSPHLLPEALFLSSIANYHLGHFQMTHQHLSTLQSIQINHSFANTLKQHISNTPLTNSQGAAITGIIDIWSNTIHITAIQNTNEKHHSPTKEETQSLGLVHNSQACSHMLQHNITSALPEIKLSIQFNPEYAVFHSNNALIYCKDNQFRNAIHAIKEAKKNQPNLDLIFLNEGLIYYKNGDITHALQSFQKAYTLNRENIITRYNLAMIYFETNNVKLAFSYLNDLIPFGLLFAPIQKHINYLEKHHKNINYWISPQSQHAFQAYTAN